MRHFGVLLTAPKAADLLGVHRDTTLRAAKRGDVEGAYQTELPGIMGRPWVATRDAWQEWFGNRRRAGRPAKNREESL